MVPRLLQRIPRPRSTYDCMGIACRVSGKGLGTLTKDSVGLHKQYELSTLRGTWDPYKGLTLRSTRESQKIKGLRSKLSPKEHIGFSNKGALVTPRSQR